MSFVVWKVPPSDGKMLDDSTHLSARWSHGQNLEIALSPWKNLVLESSPFFRQVLQLYSVNLGVWGMTQNYHWGKWWWTLMNHWIWGSLCFFKPIYKTPLVSGCPFPRLQQVTTFACANSSACSLQSRLGMIYFYPAMGQSRHIWLGKFTIHQAAILRYLQSQGFDENSHISNIIDR